VGSNGDCKRLLASRLFTFYSLRLLFCVNGRVQKLTKYLHGRKRCFGTTLAVKLSSDQTGLLSRRLRGFLRPNGFGSVWRFVTLEDTTWISRHGAICIWRCGWFSFRSFSLQITTASSRYSFEPGNLIDSHMALVVQKSGNTSFSHSLRLRSKGKRSTVRRTVHLFTVRDLNPGLLSLLRAQALE
jgi:hypothetical protein